MVSAGAGAGRQPAMPFSSTRRAPRTRSVAGGWPGLALHFHVGEVTGHLRRPDGGSMGVWRI